jgi:hypothetical protein
MSENIEKSPGADYEVGYGRPPVHSRFRKGQSGNPRGRRPRDQTMPEALRKALWGKVVVSENGTRRKVPRIEIAARQLANKAAAGDLGAIRLIVQIYPEAKQAVGSTIQLIVSEADMKL